MFIELIAQLFFIPFILVKAINPISRSQLSQNQSNADYLYETARILQSTFSISSDDSARLSSSASLSDPLNLTSTANRAFDFSNFTIAELPTVDLGYSVYPARSHHPYQDYYRFTNIRYAAPPLGNLRFSPPQPPQVDRNSTPDIYTDVHCIQARPDWFVNSTQNGLKYLNVPPLPISLFTGEEVNMSEDCLKLDVYIPGPVWRNREISKAPVIVWIHGGGFVAGSKSHFARGSPAALLSTRDASNLNNIFVSINYRLGAFGFMSGPLYNSQGGTSNLGLLDQRLAFEWVKTYIHLFGGDINQVTVMGESAGGASIVHHITARAGQGEPPIFKRAIIQSPGFIPQPFPQTQDSIYSTFLAALNVTSLNQLRALPTNALVHVNEQQIRNAVPTQFVYGPTVSGDYVPKLPGVLLHEGNHHKNIELMVGYNTYEGVIFTPSNIATNEQFRQVLQDSMPKINPIMLENLVERLYPPNFNETTGYRDQMLRMSQLIGDMGINCNCAYLAKAFRRLYMYEFASWPAVHGLDLAFTFYDNAIDSAVLLRIPVARALQNTITKFVHSGQSSLPAYDVDINSPIRVFGDFFSGKRFGVNKPLSNSRCDFWQTAPYIPPNPTP